MATPEHDRENRRAGIGVGGPTDYERLVRFVLSSGGEFGLAVARATDPGVREGVMTQAILDAEAAGVRVATLDLDSFPADGDLLDALKAAAVGDGGAPLGAVFATNAEALLLDTVGRPRITPAIEGLNRRRDLLPRELPVRLVLWLSDAAADAFAELARDLRDVALTFFRFESREWPRAITRHADLPGWMYLADADEAPRLRREASLLSQMLERTPKEPQAMAEAAARIGQIHVLLGLPDEGLGWLRRAVESFRTAADQRGEATARIRLADVLRVRGQVEDSLSELGEAAKIFESLGEDRSRAITQGQIADILQARGQLDEALRIRREEELPILEHLGDARALVVARANTALNLIARGTREDRDAAARLLSLALADSERLQIPEAATIRKIMKDHRLTGRAGLLGKLRRALGA